MSEWFISLVVACCVGTLAAIAAGATPPPGENVIGLYTTADGEGENYQFVDTGESFAFFICVSGCTFEAGIVGYEFCIVQEGDGVVVMTYAYPGTSAISGFDFECPVVGLADPLLPNDTDLIVIGEVAGLSLGGEASFSLMPIEPNPSIEGEMAIADAADGWNIASAVPASGSHDIPCFSINQLPPTGVESTSWARLKSLYR